MFFFFKQKTAYEMRISDWSSDVCSSDLWCYIPPSCEGRDMTKWKYILHHPKFWPVVGLKTIITATLVATHFAPQYAAVVAVTGNLLWLWGPTTISIEEEL